MKNPFRYYKTSPDVIRLAVMMHVRFPLSLRQVEDLLHECGVDISYETARCAITAQVPSESLKPFAENVADIAAEATIRHGEITPMSYGHSPCYEFCFGTVLIRHTLWDERGNEYGQVDIWDESEGKVFSCTWHPFTVIQFDAGAWMSVIPILKF